MKITSTKEILATIFTRAELITISNAIGQAALESANKGYKATAENQWEYRNLFTQAAEIAGRNGNEKMEGRIDRF